MALVDDVVGLCATAWRGAMADWCGAISYTLYICTVVLMMASYYSRLFIAPSWSVLVGRLVALVVGFRSESACASS